MFKKLRFMFLFTLLFSTTLFGDDGAAKEQKKSPKKYNLSICAIFKNEAHYLKEWIEYHRLVGVGHFYLYNNKSTDHYKRVLDPYIKTGLVTLVNWLDNLGELKEAEMFKWALSTQVMAYEHAIKMKAYDTNWLVFVDIDEFLVPFEKATLTEQLAPYEECSAVTLTRLYYDASKIDTIPRRRLVIEATELIGAQENRLKSVSKTIFKPEHARGFTWPPYRPRFGCDCGEEIELKHVNIRVNRYTNRYQQGFLHFGKRKETLHIDNRTLPISQVAALLEEGYEIEDQERLIFRFVPEVLKQLDYK